MCSLRSGLSANRSDPVLLDSASLWFAQTNAWVLGRDTGGPAVLIDTPPDLEGVVDLLERNDLHLVASLVTHGHVDHVGAAGEVEQRTGALTFIHPDDDYLSLDPGNQVRALFGMMAPGSYLPAINRRPLADGDILELAGLHLEVRHTPGHTPGHCCFYLPSENWLFSGDQLFAGSIGRTDLPGGSFPDLMRSMELRVLDLPDDTRVLPGHGPETTVGRERATNPFLL